MLTKPILFLIFNRLDTTQKVFEAIRKAKPPRFYIASDGARENKEGETEKVQNVRDFVFSNIDWQCEVKTLFRDKNLGCGHAVSEAITWFFDNEEDGIILEDDCLPDPTFFNYCETLLDYYKDNEKIMHIGSNHFLDFQYGEASYYFATIQHCWGWASWRRAWKKNNATLNTFSRELIEEKLFYNYKTNEMKNFWIKIYDTWKNSDKNDVWDYQWTLSIIANDGLCINPNVNLVSNIGFGGEGTHTFGDDNPFANVKAHPLEKIIHPSEIKRSMYIDEKIMNVHFGVYDTTEKRIQRIEYIITKIKKCLFVLKPLYKIIKRVKK